MASKAVTVLYLCDYYHLHIIESRSQSISHPSLAM